MAKFWKDLIGGQVKNGIYVAGPRHASSKLGSFSTGNPPRLPFQYIVHFDINPTISAAFFGKNYGPYDLAQMVKTIDIPSMSFTVEKRPKYNKQVPVIITKEFKDFNLTVHDDISSTWLAFWQIYYNYHFTDGRHTQTGVDADDFVTEIHNSKLIRLEGDHMSQFDGLDIHGQKQSQFINNIHVYQLHGQSVQRTTAVNPIITDVQFTPLDYAGSGTSQEITFGFSYEKLHYSPVINFDYDEEGVFLEEAIEDFVKATPFNPSGDRIRGLVKGLFGLTQRAGNKSKDLSQTNMMPREDYGANLKAVVVPEEEGVGFFGNLIRNAVRKKANQLTDNLLKKNNKNLGKFKI